MASNNNPSDKPKINLGSPLSLPREDVTSKVILDDLYALSEKTYTHEDRHKIAILKYLETRTFAIDDFSARSQIEEAISQWGIEAVSTVVEHEPNIQDLYAEKEEKTKVDSIFRSLVSTEFPFRIKEEIAPGEQNKFWIQLTDESKDLIENHLASHQSSTLRHQTAQELLHQISFLQLIEFQEVLKEPKTVSQLQRTHPKHERLIDKLIYHGYLQPGSQESHEMIRKELAKVIATKNAELSEKIWSFPITNEPSDVSQRAMKLLAIKRSLDQLSETKYLSESEAFPLILGFFRSERPNFYIRDLDSPHRKDLSLLFDIELQELPKTTLQEVERDLQTAINNIDFRIPFLEILTSAEETREEVLQGLLDEVREQLSLRKVATVIEDGSFLSKKRRLDLSSIINSGLLSSEQERWVKNILDKTAFEKEEDDTFQLSKAKLEEGLELLISETETNLSAIKPAANLDQVLIWSSTLESLVNQGYAAGKINYKNNHFQVDIPKTKRRLENLLEMKKKAEPKLHELLPLILFLDRKKFGLARDYPPALLEVAARILDHGKFDLPPNEISPASLAEIVRSFIRKKISSAEWIPFLRYAKYILTTEPQSFSYLSEILATTNLDKYEASQLLPAIDQLIEEAQAPTFRFSGHTIKSIEKARYYRVFRNHPVLGPFYASMKDHPSYKLSSRESEAIQKQLRKERLTFVQAKDLLEALYAHQKNPEEPISLAKGVCVTAVNSDTISTTLDFDSETFIINVSESIQELESFLADATDPLARRDQREETESSNDQESESEIETEQENEETEQEERKGEIFMQTSEIIEEIVSMAHNHPDPSWPWISVEDIHEVLGVDMNQIREAILLGSQESRLSVDYEGQVEVPKTINLYRFQPDPLDQIGPNREEEEEEVQEDDYHYHAVGTNPTGRRMMTENKMLRALQASGTDAMESAKAGGQMAASKEFVDGVVTIAKETLPEEVRVFLETDVGEKLAPAVLSFMTNYATHVAPQYVPYAPVVQGLSKSAMDACAYENARDLTAALQPFFRRVGQYAASIGSSQEQSSSDDAEPD